MANPESTSAPDVQAPPAPAVAWWKLLNRYHWFVLIVAALGWMFDCLDQQLFTLSRGLAMKALLPPGPEHDPLVWGGYATSIFMIGWATGGLIFGMLGDRIGRAKTMMLTILVYSLCTGLSALSVGFWDFAFYRFITGIGVGGEFAVGVTLLAEVMPEKARAGALGLLQALSAVGNISAALIGMGMSQWEQSFSFLRGNGWRAMFVIGALPALLVFFIQSRLKEPDRWLALKKSGEINKRKAFTYAELFSSRLWARHAFLGLLLACTGVIGLWGIGFFSPELIRTVLKNSFDGQGLTAEAIKSKVDFWASVGLLVQQVGAFFGMLAFTFIAQRMGRRRAFALAFPLAMFATASTFLYLKDSSQIFWMLPMMGFFQLSLFAVYAIYLPELFPTHLRSTGTSFCYNVGRYVSALAPPVLGLLKTKVFGAYPDPIRYAGVTMCSIFLLGLIVLPFLPETKDRPLPEGEGGFVH